MKIGLLLGANLYFCPYVNIYKKILDEYKIDYDIISWKRIDADEKGAIFYDKRFSYATGNRIKWLQNHFRYSLFIKRQIKINKYDKLIVFGPHVGLFLYFLLTHKYKNKFCFDYRDIFIEQKVRFLFKNILKSSSMIVISSLGFLRYLPKGFNYVISHNFDVDILKKFLNFNSVNVFDKNKIIITTIGQIRDFKQNLELMSSLSNESQFVIKFIGNPGTAGLKLRKIANENNQKNICFSGQYKKEEEALFINETDFINIYYPQKASHSTALSNRFYNSLIFRKPMLVTKNSTQGDLVEKNNLGIALLNCENLDKKIQQYKKTFNPEEFNNNCKNLMAKFLLDYDVFEENLLKFINRD